MAAYERYIVLDTETTGLYREARVIELAAVKVDHGVIIDKRSQFFDPGMPLPPQITAITGITDEMLRGRSRAAEVLPRFRDFCEGLPIVGHNIRFDMARLKYEAQLANLRLPLLYGADTMLMARALIPKSEIGSYSLHNLINYFHIQQLPTHRALADVYATQALYSLLTTCGICGICGTCGRQ